MRKSNTNWRKKLKLSRSRFSVFIIILVLFFWTNFNFSQENVIKEQNKLIKDYKSANNYFRKGETQFYKKNYKKAEKNFKKCIEIFSNHSNAYFYLSKGYYHNGNLQGALDYIVKAKSTYKDFVKVVFISKRRNLDVLRENMKELRNRSNYASTDEGRNQMRTAMNKTREKMDGMQKRFKDSQIVMKNLKAEFFYFHGNVYFKLKKFQETLNEYVEAIRINPKHSQAYNNLISLFYMGKQYKRASEYLKLAESNDVKVNPKLKDAVNKAVNQ